MGIMKFHFCSIQSVRSNQMNKKKSFRDDSIQRKLNQSNYQPIDICRSSVLY